MKAHLHVRSKLLTCRPTTLLSHMASFLKTQTDFLSKFHIKASFSEAINMLFLYPINYPVSLNYYVGN